MESDFKIFVKSYIQLASICGTNLEYTSAEYAIPPCQKGFLHEAARFDTARLVVITFSRRSAAMTKQSRGDANMCRVVDRDARRGGIPE
jgi:hypothetical protein